MSLGEIDTTFHKLKTINYVPLISSNVNYLIKVKSILIGNNKQAIKSKNDAIIDTGNTISYFPSTLYKSLIKDFNSFCNAHKGKCGEFKTEPEYGYCASFKDRESLFDAIYFHWPNITLEFDKDKQYIWKPINYYYYYLKKSERKACLGFNIHKSQNIILGTNFIHGHDIIFDREKQKLGFVPADCSRGNILWKRNTFFSKFNIARFVDDPKMIDKEIHKNENEGKFGLGDNNNNEMLEFIQGHNTELDFGGDFRFINFIILLTSVIIVVLVIIVVIISALLCNKRGYLRYDEPNNIEYMEETYEENNSTFKIGDLVQINNTHTICYILDASKYFLKVIDTSNEIKNISIRDVFQIHVNKKNTGIDSRRNPITKDNIVKIINGPYKGAKATIKCLYKKFVFLHNNDYIQSNGIFVDICDNIEILGSELLMENGENGRVNQRKVPEEIQNLIGKVVHIIKGVWKGYNGILKDANDKFIYVELTAKQKTIRLSFQDISKGDVNDSEVSKNDSMTTPNMAYKTPAYYPQTPTAHSPGWNMMTTPNNYKSPNPWGS
jgi:transcription antitermination factor NusG